MSSFKPASSANAGQYDGCGPVFPPPVVGRGRFGHPGRLHDLPERNLFQLRRNRGEKVVPVITASGCSARQACCADLAAAIACPRRRRTSRV